MSLVEIKPDVLQYASPLTQQSTEFAIISNNSSETIAFKVKTTAPKYYCVRPNAAVVAPGETVSVQVIFLGLPEEPQPDFKCRDKFLVITLPAPIDLGEKTVAEAWSELEAQYGKDAVSKKIKVKYVIKSQEELDAESAKENITKNNLDNSSVTDTTSTDEIKKNIHEEQPIELNEEVPVTAVEDEKKINEGTTQNDEVTNEKDNATNEKIQSDKLDITPTSTTNSPFNLVNIIVGLLIAFLLKWLFF